MKITTDLIKQLREKTGISIKECHKALSETGGNLEKAIEALRKKGEQVAIKKITRETKSGIVEAYVHTDSKQAALVKIVCETDFVAKNKEFKNLAHNLAMQIVALEPRWISSDDISKDTIKKEKEIYLEKIDKNKSKAIKEKIIQGKLEKFYSENCLLKQPFIKDDNITIEKLIAEYVNKLGEKIEVREFIKFKI